MNLLRILSLSVKRVHKLKKSNTGSFEKCKDTRCLASQQVIFSSTYKTKNGQIIKRNANMNCKSKDYYIYSFVKNVRRNIMVKRAFNLTFAPTSIVIKLKRKNIGN